MCGRSYGRRGIRAREEALRPNDCPLNAQASAQAKLPRWFRNTSTELDVIAPSAL